MKIDNPRILTGEDGESYVERFGLLRRVEHSLVIAVVLMLLITGLSQKFYDLPGSTFALGALGGLDATRRVHHAVGILSVLYLVAHIGSIVIGFAAGRMKPVLLPTPQDVIDFLRTWKYRFGYSNAPVQFGMFNYRQKFQYVALLIAGALVVFSGLALLFPQATTSWLPGHVIPAAREIHAHDGMWAFVLLILWHVYETVVSPDSPRGNWSIFTGYISKASLKKFHSKQYDQFFGSR